MNLIIAALAPVLIILLYVWFRDRYEREPFKKLLLALLGGVLIVLPVIRVEGFLMSWMPEDGKVVKAAWQAFVVAGFTEELFKYLAVLVIIWRSREFNEKFDGIVYAVFVSLGFAAVENVLYVAQGGMQVAITRALTAVPAHAIFGVTMGYYLGIARMYPRLRSSHLALALLMPLVLHGIYDFILMVEIGWLLTLFIPYVIWLYISGIRKMKRLSDASIYRN